MQDSSLCVELPPVLRKIALHPGGRSTTLAQRRTGAPSLRSLRRVLAGRVVAGLKATERGLLCGRMSGIGDSAAGELLCGSSSIGV